MKSICVFCGSGTGNSIIYREKAIELGFTLAQKKIKLIYGGAKVGLMGLIADTVLEYGGEVTGVIPQALVNKEIAHKQLTELKIVENMHERKMLMNNLSDGFIAMPGGLGTLEEIFEALAWGQLDIHNKPCAFYNVNNYYNRIYDFLKYSIEEGFIHHKHLDLIIMDDNPNNLINRLYNYHHPKVNKAEWIKGKQSN